MGSPYLKWTGTDGNEQVRNLNTDEILLGRKSDANIVFTDPYISRHHAKLIRKGDGYLLLDLGSTHGSHINGKRVTEQLLHHGDTVSLGKGRIELTYYLDDIQQIADDTTIDITVEKSIMDLTAVFPSVVSDYSDLEKLSFLLEVQYNLGRNFSAGKTFEQILANALKISGAERGFILLNKRDEDFEYVVGMDGEGRILPQTEFIQASQTVVRQVATSGEPVFMTEGIADDLAQQKSIVAMNVRALSCMPLKWISSDSNETAVRGIIYLDSTKMMHALSGLDQQILNRLATEAATVFERVEMIETFEERKLFNQELSLARETQQTLLPQAVPELEPFRLSAFSEPTHHVGGDFYDFLDVGPDRLAGVLADVSGKGVSAALLSSLVQGSLQMEVRSGTDFGEALTRINRFLMDRLQANRFVTLFIFKIEPNGQGHFVSAGHNPAYLFRSRIGSIEELKSEHMILGAFNFAEYASQTFDMEPKDILVIYTDGLTEAEDPQGDMFGEERLKHLIIEQAPKGGEHLRRTILSNIKDFTQGRAQTDDITFMLVEHGG